MYQYICSSIYKYLFIYGFIYIFIYMFINILIFIYIRIYRYMYIFIPDTRRKQYKSPYPVNTTWSIPDQLACGLKSHNPIGRVICQLSI